MDGMSLSVRSRASKMAADPKFSISGILLPSIDQFKWLAWWCRGTHLYLNAIGNVPRKFSSRSFTGLRYDSEALSRSTEMRTIS